MSASDDFLKREMGEEAREELIDQRKTNLGALALLALTGVLLTVGYNWFVYMGWIGHN